jgi:uncharacterized protein
LAGEILAARKLKPSHATLVKLLVRGTFPELWRDPTIPYEQFYRSYVRSYLERDLREALNVSKLRDFERFLRSCAVRAGQLLNHAELARDVGIAVSTAHEWISAMQAGNIIVLLEPYFANLGKRLVKSPKLYFTETGLLCHLLGLTEEGLERTPLVGSVWENFVFAELRRKTHLAAPERRIFFYRDQQSREIDFLVESDGAVSLLETKWTERPDKSDARTIEQIASLFAEAKPHPLALGRQAVICRTTMDYPLTETVEAVSWNNFM